MNNEIKTDLGNQEIFVRNVKRYLAHTGKTQKEVAEAIGVTAGTFCDWMNKRSYPKMDKIEKLARYFGIKKSDLVEDVNVASETISDKEQEIFDLFHKIPEEKRELVLSMIRAAVDNL